MGLCGTNRPLAGTEDPGLWQTGEDEESRAPKGDSLPTHRPRRSCVYSPPRAHAEDSAPAPKNMETGVRPLLLPEGHTAPRSRTCRRPKVLRTRSSSSGLPAPGLGSKTPELFPAAALPCCWLSHGGDLCAYFRPRSGTTPALSSPAGLIRTAFPRRPRAGRRRLRPRPAGPAPSPGKSGSSVPECRYQLSYGWWPSAEAQPPSQERRPYWSGPGPSTKTRGSCACQERPAAPHGQGPS